MLKIALTGGPCAGKTAALTHLSKTLSSRGWYPLLVPESPTLLMLHNIKPSDAFDEKTFQYFVIRTMRDMESIFDDAAGRVQHKNPIIICDRGIPDALAYMPEYDFEKVLEELGFESAVAVRDRYAGVFHLRTAAIGAEAYYSHVSNAARRESLEEARRQDALTLESWRGHAQLHVIENNFSFEEKLQMLDTEVCRFLQIPAAAAFVSPNHVSF